MEDIAKTLPADYSYEWTGATFQEKKTGGQTGYIFALSLLFVFLVLAALYESWAMPVAIFWSFRSACSARSPGCCYVNSPTTSSADRAHSC